MFRSFDGNEGLASASVARVPRTDAPPRTYNIQNQLTASSGGTATSLAYDPLDRLDTYNPGTLRRFVYDGVEAAAELDSSGAIQDRYVRGDGADELIVDYSGSGTTNRRFTSADEWGSIISLTDSSGNLVGIDRYDEYGKPQPTNVGRFQYTGQAWLSEANVAYYKARTYLPHLGIFGQTDPAGYADSANLYAYVLNDPLNLVDPSGMATQIPPTPCDPNSITCPITITAELVGQPPSASFSIGSTNGGRNPCDPAAFDPNTCPITITGNRHKTKPKPKAPLPPSPPIPANKICSSAAAGTLFGIFTAGLNGTIEALGAPLLVGEVATEGLAVAGASAALSAVVIGAPLLIAGTALAVGVYVYDQRHHNEIGRKLRLSVCR